MPPDLTPRPPRYPRFREISGLVDRPRHLVPIVSLSTDSNGGQIATIGWESSEPVAPLEIHKCILLDVADVDRARAWAAGADLKAAMQNAGVLGEPVMAWRKSKTPGPLTKKRWKRGSAPERQSAQDYNSEYYRKKNVYDTHHISFCNRL